MSLPSLTYTIEGPWGAGVGRVLTAQEHNNNVWNLDSRVTDLEKNPPEPNDISNMAVAGSQWTIYLKSGASFGPYTLPRGPKGDTAFWLTGAGAPDAELGEPGDIYFDTETADVYQHEGTDGWQLIANLGGPEGPPGSVDSVDGEAPDTEGNVQLNAVRSDMVRHIVMLSQAEYDALSPPDDSTLYLIEEDEETT